MDWKPTIITLLLSIAIMGSPLCGQVNSHADKSGHAHQHFHDGSDHTHHHHHHDDDKLDGHSLGSDHHSELEGTPDTQITAWRSLRRIEVSIPLFPHMMVAVTIHVGSDWQPNLRVKPPPWLSYSRSSQTNQIRTVILLV